MIVLLTSVVLPLLFVGSGTLGVAVLCSSWRRQAGAFAGLRAELAALSAAAGETPALRHAGRRTPPVAAPVAAGPRRAAVRPVRAMAPARPLAAVRAAA